MEFQTKEEKVSEENTSQEKVTQENVSMNMTESNKEPAKEPSKETSNEIKLVDVDITDENIALNVLVAFIALAQRRGVYAIDESAKIWECVKKFQKNN